MINIILIVLSIYGIGLLTGYGLGRQSKEENDG